MRGKVNGLLGRMIIVFLLFYSEKLLAASPEYIMNEETAPDSAKDIEGPLGYGFLKEYHPVFVFKWLREEVREELEALPPFFRNTVIKAKVRNYYFHRDNSRIRNFETWAIGGGLEYRSGWAFDLFRVGTTWYTSQKLYGPAEKGGSLLLKPIQESFTVFGEAYIDIKLFGDIFFRGYRQSFDYPYLNRQDSRMVPNTFEAYVLRNDDRKDWDWIAGHVTKIKRRFSDTFVPLSRAASGQDSDDGLTMAGFRYNFNAYDNIGAVNYYSWNVMNTFYMEGNYLWKVTDDVPVRFGIQFTQQSSVGRSLLGNFNTYSVAGQVSSSYEGVVLRLAAASTGKDRGIISPYGAKPSYLSIMVKDFDRRGEFAWLVGLSYNFQHFSFLDGLSFFTNYASGYTDDIDGQILPDQREWDITVDYRPTEGYLEGLWLRFRRSQVDQDDGLLSNNSVDYRVILNFEIQFL